ncbi:MAG: UDP-2,3-diacylglucosamine diphosphatase [Lentilitoribacter sp.]
MSSEFKYRAIFLSDIHLGTKGCQADMLLDFLREYDAEFIYLVGDIFDGWRLKKGWFWPQSHNDVVQKLLRKSRKGSKIIYVPGNHDEVMRNYLGTHFGGIEVKDRDIYTSLRGEQFLIIHGDQYDMVVMNAKWLAHVGDWAYETTLKLSRYVNKIRRFWGGQYWSLSRWAKHKVKTAVNFIGDYEQVLILEAQKEKVDGIICGHIHHPTINKMGSITYINTGDWVENCSAIVERHDGEFELIEWSKIIQERAKTQSETPLQITSKAQRNNTALAKH